MNTLLWIVQIALAAVFAGAGSIKLLRSKAEVIDKLGDWAESFPAPGLRLLGLAEILGALAMFLPAVTGLALVLTPVAAACLAAVMVGATAVHARRAEYSHVVVNVLLGLAAAAVAWARFGPHPL